MDIQKVISKKLSYYKLFFLGVLKVTNENSRIRIHKSVVRSVLTCHGSGTIFFFNSDAVYITGFHHSGSPGHQDRNWWDRLLWQWVLVSNTEPWHVSSAKPRLVWDILGHPWLEWHGAKGIKTQHNRLCFTYNKQERFAINTCSNSRGSQGREWFSILDTLPVERERERRTSAKS